MRSWNGFLFASALAACMTPVVSQDQAPPASAERALPTSRAQDASAAPAAPAAPELPAVEQPDDARALFVSFAAMSGLEARFEEEKHLALLAAPLRTSGRLYFMPPGYLARVVEEPERSVVIISPTELRMSGKERIETIDLRGNPQVRLFVTSLVRVFSGDEVELENSYTIAFESGEQGWTLTLTPREPPLSDLLADLTLRGTGLAVSELVVRDANGDRTVTRILEADTGRRFTEEEQASLFGISPR